MSYILIVSRGIPADRYPLNGIFEFDQAKALAKKGNKIIYLGFDLRSLRRWRKFGFYSMVKSGVRVENFAFPVGNIPKRLFLWIGSILFSIVYRSIVRKYGKPSIMHAHFYNMALICQKVAQKNNINLIITEHSSDLIMRCFDDNLMRRISQVYRSSSLVIAVSSPLAAKIKKEFGVEAKCIENIIDTEYFRFNSEKKKSENTFIFITVANLVQWKGVDVLLQAFCDVFADNRNVYLKIIGSGPEEDALKAIVYSNGMIDRIEFLGRCDRSEIARWFSVANCFVLPSRVETFGVVFAEAMASGLPVIATKCGGPESFVNENNGILVDVDDRVGLGKAMQEMVLTVDRYDNRAIAECAHRRWSGDLIADQIAEVYAKVIGK